MRVAIFQGDRRHHRLSLPPGKHAADTLTANGLPARAPRRRSRQWPSWMSGAVVSPSMPAAGRTQGASLQALYRRLAARRGKQRATVAVGHTIRRIADHLRRDPTSVEVATRIARIDDRDCDPWVPAAVANLLAGRALVEQPVGARPLEPDGIELRCSVGTGRGAVAQRRRGEQVAMAVRDARRKCFGHGRGFLSCGRVRRVARVYC